MTNLFKTDYRSINQILKEGENKWRSNFDEDVDLSECNLFDENFSHFCDKGIAQDFEVVKSEHKFGEAVVRNEYVCGECKVGDFCDVCIKDSCLQATREDVVLNRVSVVDAVMLKVPTVTNRQLVDIVMDAGAEGTVTGGIIPVKRLSGFDQAVNFAEVDLEMMRCSDVVGDSQYSTDDEGIMAELPTSPDCRLESHINRLACTSECGNSDVDDVKVLNEEMKSFHTETVDLKIVPDDFRSLMFVAFTFSHAITRNWKKRRRRNQARRCYGR